MTPQGPQIVDAFTLPELKILREGLHCLATEASSHNMAMSNEFYELQQKLKDNIETLAVSRS